MYRLQQIFSTGPCCIMSCSKPTHFERFSKGFVSDPTITVPEPDIGNWVRT